MKTLSMELLGRNILKEFKLTYETIKFIELRNVGLRHSRKNGRGGGNNNPGPHYQNFNFKMYLTNKNVLSYYDFFFKYSPIN